MAGDSRTKDAGRNGARTSGKAPWVLHPFLFALYPVLALLAENVQQMPASVAFRPIAVVLVGAIIVLVFLRWITGDWHLAAALATLYGLLFFTYGHAYGLAKTARLGGELIGRHRYLAPLWVAGALLGTLALFRSRERRSLTSVLNLATAVLLALPLYTLIAHSFTLQRTGPEAQAGRSGSNLALPGEDPPPDIYYIVVDSYGREDFLRERYGYDNSAFLENLRERGFYVADESRSNYGVTVFSLSSSLNLSYIQDLGVDLRPGSGIGVLAQMLKQSEVRRQLEDLGYVTVATTTGLVATELDDADYFLAPQSATGRLGEFAASGAVTPFEGFLIDTSALKIVLDLDRLSLNRWLVERLEDAFYVEREIILSAFQHLEEAPSIPGPKFVFVHIISPHGPYIFGPNGEPVTNEGPFTLTENEVDEDRARDVPRYLDQLVYVNSRLVSAIDAILSNSDRPPIIILQSDHGPGFGKRWANPTHPEMTDRYSILNAYYFPDGCSDQLYPTISPVNTFRLIFRCYFQGDYPPLEDIAFVSNYTGSKPYDFVPLEEALQ